MSDTFKVSVRRISTANCICDLIKEGYYDMAKDILDVLIKNEKGAAQSATTEQPREVRMEIYDYDRANKIPAIKEFRQLTGVGLKEAKYAVEALESGKPFVTTVDEETAKMPIRYLSISYQGRQTGIKSND